LTLSHPTTGTVTLTGDDLSIEEVVRIARRGARVEIWTGSWSGVTSSTA
jgi:hypothetical protein